MAKGSGGTRSGSPRTWSEAISAAPNARLAFVMAHIQNIDNDLQADQDAVLAFDSLSDAQRDELLQRLKFSGLTSDDEFYGGEGNGMLATMQRREKNDMFVWVDDYTYHNEPDDDQSFWIGYKDGTIVDTRDYSEKHKFKRSNATFVFGEGLMSGYYWATKEGLAQMRTIGNFSEWKNGKKVK